MAEMSNNYPEDDIEYDTGRYGIMRADINSSQANKDASLDRHHPTRLVQTGTVRKTSNRGALLVLVFLAPFGFFTNLTVGPVNFWINNSFGGLLYAVF